MSKIQNLVFQNYDIIYNKTHKPSSVYKYFQQIATDDLDVFGVFGDELFNRGLAFVLVKMKTVFTKPIFKYDNLVLKTCHRRIKGVTFIRDYVIERNGETIGESSSYWALIDINSRKLCRPSLLSDDKSFNPLASFEIDDRFRFPDDLSTANFNYNVAFCDVDENNHMNNTRYPDVCLDAIKGILPDEYVSEIRIDYLSEAVLSDSLEITFNTERLDDTYYFSAFNATTSAKCFDAIIKINKI